MADTYASLNAMLGALDRVASGKNADGENVIISRGEDGIRTSTFQHNGWTRVNYYHPDGTVEELYER